jgi:hypothetical protein
MSKLTRRQFGRWVLKGGVLVPLVAPVVARGITIVVRGPRRPPPAGGGGDFITGQTLGTARNDFAGCVGFEFTVGGSSVSVTHVARWVISGNSNSHTTYLCDASGNILTNGSVSINTSGAPVGFLFVALPATVVLSASTTYALLTEETGSADQWYDHDTSVSHTAVATINRASYANSVGGSLNNGNAGAKSFGPVSFRYT